MFKDIESQIEGIKEIFETARTEDGWNLEGEMLYSFYFVDEDMEKLEELGNKLEAGGYDVIGIYELGDEETEEPSGELMLHIDTVEIHTPETLAARNVEFAELVKEHGIDSYDGWEFGEVGDYYEDDEFDEDDEEESEEE